VKDKGRLYNFVFKNIFIKFKAIEAFLNAYGETELIKETVHMLFERFKEGTENINYIKRSGRPNVVTSSHVAAVKAHLEKYRCKWMYPTYYRIHVDSGL